MSPTSRQKYLIPGETQDLALMFVPSESVYAELYDGFDDVVQKAYRAKVVIVSPSLLMLAINVVQQIQKDARMREAADKIHAEVGHLMDDIKRLQERVLRLQQHHGQAGEDMRQILISAEKVEKRGARIREVEFDEDAERRPATSSRRRSRASCRWGSRLLDGRYSISVILRCAPKAGLEGRRPGIATRAVHPSRRRLRGHLRMTETGSGDG